MICNLRRSSQGSGDEEEGGAEALWAADEAGGAGHRPRGEQTDRSGNLQAQLPGPAHLRRLVTSPSSPPQTCADSVLRLASPPFVSCLHFFTLHFLSLHLFCFVPLSLSLLHSLFSFSCFLSLFFTPVCLHFVCHYDDDEGERQQPGIFSPHSVRWRPYRRVSGWNLNYQ